ncbi:MAG: hypothetical protein AAB478_01905 [Patescibacteria group bacterium]
MEEKKEESSSLMHDLKESSTGENRMKFIGIFIIVVLLGVGTGYGLTKVTGSGPTQGSVPGSSAPQGATYGTSNTKDYPDVAEGVLRKGGIEDEGAFHLERPGGESQNVYMTSSNVDLAKLVGKKIKVWGQTQSAQHAGWLMDVGKVEVL